MAFYKAAEHAAAVSAPVLEAVNLERALRPLLQGSGNRHNPDHLSDYDAWLSSDPGLVQFAIQAVDSRFVGRRSEREMLCFTMKKVRFARLEKNVRKHFVVTAALGAFQIIQRAPGDFIHRTIGCGQDRCGRRRAATLYGARGVPA